MKVHQRHVFASTNQSTNHLVDRGANGGVAGADMRILQTPDWKINIIGIDDHELTGLDVVTAAFMNMLTLAKEDLLMLLDRWNGSTGLQMSGLLCLVKYSSIPTPLLYVSCSSGPTLSSGFPNLLAVNLGVPGVRDSLSFIAISPNLCTKLLIIDDCPNHPLVFSFFM